MKIVIVLKSKTKLKFDDPIKTNNVKLSGSIKLCITRAELFPPV